VALTPRTTSSFFAAARLLAAAAIAQACAAAPPLVNGFCMDVISDVILKILHGCDPGCDFRLQIFLRCDSGCDFMTCMARERAARAEDLT